MCQYRLMCRNITVDIRWKIFRCNFSSNFTLVGILMQANIGKGFTVNGVDPTDNEDENDEKNPTTELKMNTLPCPLQRNGEELYVQVSSLPGKCHHKRSEEEKIHRDCLKLKSDWHLVNKEDHFCCYFGNQIMLLEFACEAAATNDKKTATLTTDNNHQSHSSIVYETGASAEFEKVMTWKNERKPKFAVVKGSHQKL